MSALLIDSIFFFSRLSPPLDIISYIETEDSVSMYEPITFKPLYQDS